MPQSINGWTVLLPGSEKLKTLPVPGVPQRSITAHVEVLPLLLALASDYNHTIAPLVGGTFDEWSYAYRKSRLNSNWSDHSSGTAVDFNSAHEGAQGTGPYKWWASNGHAEQAVALKQKYKVFIWGGARKLGGDYGSSRYWDWMHWAIAPGTSVALVRKTIASLGLEPDGTLEKPKPVLPYVNYEKVATAVRWFKEEPDLVLVTRALDKAGYHIEETNTGSQAIKDVYQKWQQALGYEGDDANGIPGLESLTKLGAKSGLFRTS